MNKNTKNFSSPIAEKCRLLRSKLGLTQNEMAKQLNVCLRTWQSWEVGRNQPRAIHLLSVLEMESKTGDANIVDRCCQLRNTIGVTRKEMAKLIGVRPHTWGYWELGKQKPNSLSRGLIDKLYNCYILRIKIE